MRKAIYKNILLSIFVVLLIIPATQGYFKIFEEKPLLGAMIPASDTILTPNAWFSGRFQLKREKFLNENFGFRNFFVRLNNQIAYSFYNVAKANGVVIGKDNVLYQTGYIDSYFGNDFAGNDTLTKQVQKFKVVQDALLKKAKYLIFVFAPGKGTVYPEYIPDKYFEQKKKTTNHEAILEEFKKYNVTYVDFDDYFSKNKNKFTHPLFPRCGTHWSGYAATIVMDSLMRFCEKISNKDFIDFKSLEGYSTNTEMKFTDSDIGDAMNLLFPIKNWKMYYPNVTYENQPDKVRPNFLFIGDSFTQSLYSFYPYFTALFGNQTVFWGYNNIICWPDSLEKQYIKVSDLNQFDEIMKRDFIIVVCTEINLNNFNFSFADKAYTIFSNEDSINYWEKVRNKEDEIKNNNEFMKLVIKQAEERKVSIKENIYINAKYIIDCEKTNK
jgi:hypothetical protein